MKASCSLFASVFAASTVALSSSSSSSASSGCRDGAFYPCSKQGLLMSSGENDSEKEKFAPRFDGLRFIETLVTAHR